MNDPQLGMLFRAVRIHLRLRQEDAERRAGVSPSSVSRIERGLFATLPLEMIRAIGGALEIRLGWSPAWRGGNLERVMNARHSALHERLAARVEGAAGWMSAAEVSYSIWGERGVIDRLAYHADRRMLAVFEIKPDLCDPAGLVAQVDRYRRLAPENRPRARVGSPDGELLGGDRRYRHEPAAPGRASGAAAGRVPGGRSRLWRVAA